MTPRIYSADEARTLLDGATPGPYALERFGEVVATIDGHAMQVASALGQAPKHDMRGEHDAIRKANAALIAAAPDLAASVVHHAERADELSAECVKVRAAWASECHRSDDATARADAAEAALAAAHARIAELERLATGPRTDGDGREVSR